MKKIFSEYGGVIVTVIAIVALITLVTFLMQPGNVMDGAFSNVVQSFVDKTDELVNDTGFSTIQYENTGTSEVSSAQTWGVRFGAPVDYIEINPTCSATSGTYSWTRYKTADGSALTDSANLIVHSSGSADIGSATAFTEIGLDDFIAFTPDSGTLLYANSKTRINYPNAKLAYITKSTGEFSMSNTDNENMAFGGVFSVKKTMKWEGKTWACVGDSLTESYIPTNTHYFEYVAAETGITPINFGMSGTGWKAGETNNQAFYQRILSVPADVDVVTIFGSGNDLGYELGTPTDTGTDTICGCINTTIDNLYSVNPDITLAIVTPTPWSPYNPDNANNKMALLSDAILQICEARSIPCLDLYRESGLRPWEPEFRDVAYTKETDSNFLIHPDETGHEIIAPKFKSLLEGLL